MPEVNMTEYLATTLEEVEKVITQTFEQEASTLAEVQKLPHVPTNQKGRVFPLMTSPNPDIKYRDESGAYASGGTHKAKQMRVFYARIGITRRISGDVLDLGDRGTLINAFTDGMDMDITTLMKDINQEVWSDGTGLKAVVTSVSTVTITCALPLGVLRILENGKYQFYDPATGAARSATVFTVIEGGVNRTSRTITLSASAAGLGITAGDHIAWEDSYLKTITGMEKLVADDTGDFQGVSRALVPSLRSPNVDASNRRLTLSLIDQQELQIVFRAGKMKTGNKQAYRVNPTQLQAYRDLGRNYQEYASGTKFDGGNGGIENQTANGRKIEIDVDIKYSDWWLLDMSKFRWCELRPLGIVDRDGHKLRMVPGYSSAGAGSFLDSNVYMIDMKGDLALLEPRYCSRMLNLDTTGLTSPHFN